MHQHAIKSIQLLFVFLAVIFGLDTMSQGQDFEVFYKACQFFINKEKIYDLSRDGGMVFKYPPWVVTWYLPFILIPIKYAKFVCGAFHAVVLWYLFNHLSNFEKGITKRLFVIMVFWGIWISHVLDGQISLFVLFLCLLVKPYKSAENLLISSTLLTFKIFSIFSVLPYITKRIRTHKIEVISVTAVALIFILGAILWAQIPTNGIINLFQDWLKAANSGSELLSIGKTRGRENQSLTALILRLFPGLFSISKIEVITACIVAGVLYPIWFTLTKGIHEYFVWIGSLALIPVIHPLAWVHLFVFAFPLLASVTLLIWKTTYYPWTKAFVFLLLLIFVINSKRVIGLPGEYLQLASSRSLIVLIFLFIAVKYNFLLQGREFEKI